MANEFWNTLNTATSALKNIDAMYNESQINDRVNAIAHALVDNGNNLEALDPSLYSDSYGLAALGRVTKQYSETSEGQKKIAENAIARAQRDGQMIGGYLNAINEAIQNGDTDRGGAYFQSLSERIGTPYTVQYDPRTKAFDITDRATGELIGMKSMPDMLAFASSLANNSKAFQQFNLTNAQTANTSNIATMSDPSKHVIGIGKDGKPITLVPQLGTDPTTGKYTTLYAVAGYKELFTPEQIGQMGIGQLMSAPEYWKHQREMDKATAQGILQDKKNQTMLLGIQMRNEAAQQRADLNNDAGMQKTIYQEGKRDERQKERLEAKKNGNGGKSNTAKTESIPQEALQEISYSGYIYDPKTKIFMKRVKNDLGDIVETTITKDDYVKDIKPILDTYNQQQDSTTALPVTQNGQGLKMETGATQTNNTTQTAPASTTNWKKYNYSNKQ